MAQSILTSIALLHLKKRTIRTTSNVILSCREGIPISVDKHARVEHMSRHHFTTVAASLAMQLKYRQAV
jgi:hypothetical protein